MDNLSALDPLAWNAEALKEHPAYHAGNALGWLYRGNKQAATNYPLAGRLYLSKSGWLLLSVPNALVRGVYDAMSAPGAELPTAGAMNVPNVDDDLVNAHVSVMNAEEVSKIGGDNINERGHTFYYTLGALKEIPVSNVDGISKIWAIQISSPGLAALRKSYGLSPLLRDHPFHVTVAVRRKKVLQHNEVRKAAAVYNFEGDVQGVSLRKTLHKVLDELKHPGLAYNNARTGEAVAVLPGNKKKQEEVLALLRQRLSDRAAENAQLTGRPGEAKHKRPLQEGVDYKITPRPEVRERMHDVMLSPEDIQKFIRTQGFNRLAAEHPEYQKQWLTERYRLQQDTQGNLAGKVPQLAKKQLLHGEPIYGYQLVPGWQDDVKTTTTKTSAQTKDLLPGGEADNAPDSNFDKSDLAEGRRHEREHTNNDQIAKEIAEDHLSEDPKYYEKVKQIEKDAVATIAQRLRLAKQHSDNKRYANKNQMLRELMTEKPDDWEIDDDKPKFKGVTHRPTKFRFHMDPMAIPAQIKKATSNSVYAQQFGNLLNFRRPIMYDHSKPVFQNVVDHLMDAKSRGDWMLASKQKSHMYRTMLDPHYRADMARAAFAGTLPRMNTTDRVMQLYGNDIFDTLRNFAGKKT